MSKDYRIGLVGFFGWGNFGDELFIESHRTHLGHLGTVEPVNDLTSKPYFSEPIDKVVERYDAFVIGGGDLLIPWSVSELYWRREFLQKPVFVAGVGVPRWAQPKPQAMEHYRTFLADDNVRLILARDEPSSRWIRNQLKPQIEPDWFPDLACALPYPNAKTPPGETKILGIVLRHRRDRTDDFSEVRKLCERAKTMGYTIRHIVLGTGKVGALDLEIARDFAEPDEEVRHSEDLFELCAEIGGCSALASMKFHGSVVAAMYGIPSIVMSATDKSRNFMHMIDRPELISGFLKSDLADRLPHFPAKIPRHSRNFLRNRARRGYGVLAKAIAETLG